MAIKTGLAVSRAEAWLHDNVATCVRRDFEACEAATYLASRRLLDHGLRDELREGWREIAARHPGNELKHDLAHDQILEMLTPKRAGNREASKKSNRMAATEGDGRDYPVDMRAFWLRYVDDDAQNTITESMVRAAEWLGLTEFDDWWTDARSEYEGFSIPWESHPRQAWWMFNVARSRKCLGLWSRELPILIATASATHLHTPAWKCMGFQCWYDSVLACASLMFAVTRVDTGESAGKMVRDGFEFLYKSQHESGAFPWCTNGEVSADATAIAIHALCAGDAGPSAQRAERSAQYLLDCQDDAGHWENSPYTTVLALDAIALATGEPETSITSKPAYAALGHFTVELRGRLVPPLVHGKEAGILSDAEYDVIETMIRAGKPLKIHQLGRGDARGTLTKLAKREPWNEVIYLPGTKKNGYALLGKCKTHT